MAACTGDEVIGAPFYVMEYVPGVVLRTRNDTKDLTEAQAADLSRRLAEMLAAIHAVDVDQVGLGDLGRGAGYLRRQLARWQRQWELSVTEDRPGYTQLVERLTAALPADAESQTTLVHGDYRLDNALVTLNPEPRIAAVVDWEMATLGDPLADLGLTLVYWTENGEEGWLSPGGDKGGEGTGRAGWRPTPPPAPGSGPGPSSPPSTPGSPGGTCPGSVTTWRSATSSWPSSWRASTPGTSRAKRSAKASNKKASPYRCSSLVRTRCSTRSRAPDLRTRRPARTGQLSGAPLSPGLLPGTRTITEPI